MKRGLAIGVVLGALLALPAMAEGLFLGAELVPWAGETVMPLFIGGWEGPLTMGGVGFLFTAGLTNPAILNDWYMANLTVQTNWPRTENVRVGVGVEAWAYYAAGALPYYRYSINATVQLVTGPGTLYAKAHLPVPVDTSQPYLGVKVSLGGYLVLPSLFAEHKGG